MKKIQTVCIIDDDPIYIFGTKRLMQMTDFCENFVVYNNGKEAIDSFVNIVASNDEKLPDLILLDLNMPIMDGWEFLNQFAKLPFQKRVHIYMVSSSINPEDRSKSTSYDNVENFLVKPLTEKTLEEVRNLISENQ